MSFSAVYAYIDALFEQWIWLVGAVVIANLDLIKFVLSERVSRKIERLPALRGKWRFRFLVFLVFVAGWLAWNEEHQAREKAQKATEEAVGQIKELRAELGAKANRTATIQKLQEFYTAGAQITGHGVKNLDDLEKFKTEMGVWRHETKTWISQNLSSMDAEVFNNTEKTTPVPFAYPINRDHYWYVSEMAQLRTNLQKLIESDRAKQ